MRRLIYTGIVLLTAQSLMAQDAGRAGTFARMGFGARGMGMGNSMVAVSFGEVTPYYNPALSSYSEARTGQASFGILAFDRSLNLLSYTQSIKPSAGISFGLINAGVGNIDGRDGDGAHTEDYSTYENQFFLSFSNQVSEGVSIGAAIKLYHSKLFEGVTSTTVGFDVGICVKATEDLSIGAAILDLNSKYKWNTESVYGLVDGRTTEDKFPSLRKIGVAYRLGRGILSAEYQNSSESTNLIRFGGEYEVVQGFAVRGGLDRVDPGEDATGVKPTFGITAKNSFNSWTPSLNYAYVFESFAPRGMHIITLSAEF